MDATPVVTGNVRRTVAMTLVIIAVAMAGLALVAWRELLLLVFAGIVIATALQPACELVAKHLRLRDSLATTLVYGVVSLALLASAVWLLPLLWSQALAIWEQLPTWYANAREWLLASTSRTLHRFGESLPESMPSLSKSMSSPSLSGPGDAWTLLRPAGLTLLGLFATGVIAFYWTVNRETSLRGILLLVPEHRRDYYSELVDTLFSKLGAYVRGQLILCAIVGVFSFIAYWLIGLPYALVLALVAGVLEAVPVFGPTLGAVPAIAVALTVSPQTTLLAIGASMLIQTIENYLLVPKVMNRSVGIPAVVTLLALVAFGSLFGLLGAILAIPLAAIAQTLFERLVLQADFKQQEVEVSRNLSGVLRYQLLDLIQDVRRQQRNKEADVEETTTAAFNEIEALATSLEELIAKEEAEDQQSRSLRPYVARSA